MRCCHCRCATCRWAPLGRATQLEALPGLCLHDLMQLSIERLRRFFDGLSLPSTMLDEALKLLLDEVRTRLKYLCDVGLHYLTLDRQSRTLSGGEVQRINLTTALGTSLVNTLFVLDEPSIGLHPRDMNRIVQAMHRLRDAGNTLVVVEHDPAVMLAADRLIDMGPGPGERGGQIVFDGTPQEARSANTLTGAYLGARKTVGLGFRKLVEANTPRLILEGARDHNLQNVSVEVPLQRLVCVTGVSGSGKSTLVQDVLYPALARHFGKATDTPGAFDRLLGAEQLSDAVFVDQSPIGKTARSNPASYVGAFDELRKIFADAPLARERSYTAGTFSFNAGDGRCPTCGGSGFEHVEMQFLSDVYLRCPDCDGRRYRPQILDVKVVRGPMQLSIADVLDLTVAEAAHWFQNDREVVARLQPIIDVGLDYVRLGQPVPTLSGGESQRLKLAGFLADAANGPRQPAAKHGTLFLFDEPTTGLHFDDIAKLMRALRKLQAAGHSLLVIEHNLDVIRASDWIIDLGPEGGEGGGHVVCLGTPDDVKAHPSSHTGLALREYEGTLGLGTPVVEEGRPLQAGAAGRAAKGLRRQADEAIRIVNAREHNLRNLSVDIPRGKFNVITGVSGSGKSTLAFDILFNEGQRRYLESLNAYARSIVQPAGAARGGRGVRHPAHRGHRTAPEPRWPQEHGGHHHRGLALPAPAVGQAGPAALPARRRTGEGAEHREHRRTTAARSCRPARGPAGAAGRQPQGCLHRPGQVGQGTRPHAFARGRRLPAAAALSAAGPLQGAHAGAAGGQPGGHRPTNEGELRALLSRTLELGRGVLHLLHPLDGLAAAMAAERAAPAKASARSRCSPPSAPARSAAPATPSWTRACSATTANTAGARAAWARG
jgi:excinuclease ABC subunit A